MDFIAEEKYKNQQSNKPEFSEELKLSHFTFFEEVIDEIKSRDIIIEKDFLVKLEIIIARCHLNALEVGFNEGWSFGLRQLMHIVDRSTISEKSKELLRQMVEIQKAKV